MEIFGGRNLKIGHLKIAQAGFGTHRPPRRLLPLRDQHPQLERLALYQPVVGVGIEGSGLSLLNRARVRGLKAIPSEYGTCKTVKVRFWPSLACAMFWPWLSGKGP